MADHIYDNIPPSVRNEVKNQSLPNKSDLDLKLSREEEESLQNDASSSITITKEELNACIDQAVHKAIGNVNVLLDKFVNSSKVSTVNTKTPGTPKYIHPNFSFPKYDQEEKTNL